MSFFIFLHFALIFLIIFLVLLQRSAESTVLVSSTHFSPGGANKLLVRITRIAVAIFLVNCLLISYLKYGNSRNSSDEVSTKSEKNVSVPVGQ